MLDAFQSQIPVGRDPETKEILHTTYYHYERIQLTRDKTVYAFNRGNMDLIRKVFADFEIDDQRITCPMRAPLKIQFRDGKTWREYQPAAVESMVDLDYGVLKAPPRAGKTVILSAAICMLREKTIVFAHQTDLLEQMLDTFESFTNLLELRKLRGERIVDFAREWSDFDDLDVVLCTKQTFDHINNKQHLAAIQKMFGQVLVDETHLVPAEIYSKTINRFWAARRQGCTATPKRKDGMDVILDFVMGPVIHEITPQQTKRVPMRVTTIGTGITYRQGSWPRYLTDLSRMEPRNELICRWIKKDIDQGRTVIAVTDRKPHTYELQRMLENLKIPTVVFNGDFQSRNKRREILDLMRNGEKKVMIAMRNMTTGLDIPRADTFYNLLPSANAVSEGAHAGEGGYEQQCTRVLTEFPGKDEAWCRDFVDSAPIAYACLKQRQKTYTKIGAAIERSGLDKREAEVKIDYGGAEATKM